MNFFASRGNKAFSANCNISVMFLQINKTFCIPDENDKLHLIYTLLKYCNEHGAIYLV